jgi:protein-tyrosine phosphatase
MVLAVSYFVASAAFFALALHIGGVGYVLLWPALAFFSIAVAYTLGRPTWIGKRRDGTISRSSLVFLLPFFLFAWGAWRVQKLFGRREDHCNEVSPGIWVGRWPRMHDLPPGVHMVVDLTAEFPAHGPIREGMQYLCLPALDASVPSDAAFFELVARLEQEEGGIYIHCAYGHGRSAMVAAATLLARNLAVDVADAERKLKAQRPGVSMNRKQRALLARYVALKTESLTKEFGEVRAVPMSEPRTT